MYIPEFDYISFIKPRVKNDRPPKVRNWKKPAEEIIPYSDRNLKRVPIEAVHCISGETIQFPSIKGAYKLFSIPKVYKCLKAPYGTYKHKEHFFKYL